MNDDARDGWVVVGLVDFLGDVIGVFSEVVFDFYPDIFTVFDFELDVFGDDGIVGITDDEKLGFFRHCTNLVNLTLLDKACQFASI